jgi:hypothetical protein
MRIEPMRRIGNVLLWGGVVVGVFAAIWVWFGPAAAGIPWFLGVGLVKLTFVVALALIASGAVALRMANRAAVRRLLDGVTEETVITADRRTVPKPKDGLRR